jgi:hypothetical protein
MSVVVHKEGSFKKFTCEVPITVFVGKDEDPICKFYAKVEELVLPLLNSQ